MKESKLPDINLGETSRSYSNKRRNNKGENKRESLKKGQLNLSRTQMFSKMTTRTEVKQFSVLSSHVFSCSRVV